MFGDPLLSLLSSLILTVMFLSASPYLSSTYGSDYLSGKLFVIANTSVLEFEAILLGSELLSRCFAAVLLFYCF
jgi:hypothetical protein